MNIYLYMYDDFAEFEIIFLTTFLSDQNIITVAQEKRNYKGEGKLNHFPNKILSEINPDDVDLFVIPGGDYKVACKDSDLKHLLKELNKKEKKIVAICGGSFILAKCGLLDNRKCTGSSMGLDPTDEEIKNLFKKAIISSDGIVIDKNIITATGQNFIELGCEMELMFGIISKKQMKEDYKFWKNSDSSWEKDLYSDN